jgi:hypothetical protein
MAGWHQNLKRGRTIWALEQSGEWACGICCSAMALRWTNHGNSTESMLAASSRRTSNKTHRYEYAIQDRPDMVRTLLVGLPSTVTAHGLEDPGFTARGVTDLLSSYPDLVVSLTRNPSGDACKDACRATKDNGTAPVILGLVGPPHFVICHSHIRRLMRSTIHLIADPGHGDVVEGHITISGNRPYLTTEDCNRYGTIIDEMIAVRLK